MQNSTDCAEIKKQFNRIQGQTNAIGKMIDEGRDYVDIVQQISAARNALSALGIELLKDESNKCFDKSKNEDKLKKFEELVTKFFKLT